MDRVAANITELFNERRRQISLVLLLVEVALWPLWIIFDAIFSPEIMHAFLGMRLFFCGFAILTTALLYFRHLPLSVAHLLFALPPFGSVAYMFNRVPEAALFPYFVGGTMVVLAIYIFSPLSKRNNILILAFAILSVAIFHFAFPQHTWSTLGTNGGFLYLSILLMASGYNFVQFNAKRREFLTAIQLEQSNEKLRSQSEELNEKNLQLQLAIQERETLLKEIHHRVKNNLQIISSLLRLQEPQTAYRTANEILELNQTRIKTMSIIHEILYTNENLSQVNVDDYLGSLINHFKQLYGATSGHIQIELDCEPIDLPMDSLIPCGLIVNEAVTNSIKYAFNVNEGSPKPLISIVVKQLNTVCILEVNDNGIGFYPEREDLSKKIGLPLMKGLAQQLKGNIEINSVFGTGTKVKLVFENKTQV